MCGLLCCSFFIHLGALDKLTDMSCIMFESKHSVLLSRTIKHKADTKNYFHNEATKCLILIDFVGGGGKSLTLMRIDRFHDFTLF